MPATTSVAGPSPSRLLAVDIFRGLAVAGMLFVDYQGDEEAAYWPLMHAKWNGWTAADLVFPSFVFLVGVSIALSIPTRLARGESRRDVFLHALRRTFILIALGVLLNGFPGFDLATWRMEGVVQRIAVCYLVAVALQLWSGERAQVTILAACLVGYWVLLRLVPIPGLGLPGRDVRFMDPERNLTAWLDRAVFPGRLYDGVRDPEGLLSTLPAVASALWGLLAGRWLLSANASRERKAVVLFLAGLLGVGAGLLWGLWFPINKNMWTSSYVVFTSGFAMAVLALLYWMVEIRGWRGRWTMPFLVFGTNAILGFVLDMLIYAPMHYGHVRTADGTVITWKEHVLGGLRSFGWSTATVSLVYATGMVLVCWILLWPLYRKRIFVKI